MERIINKIDSCNYEMVITLTEAEVLPYYNEAYRNAQPNVNLKGFRKGKAPLNMVKKYFGPKLEAEANFDIVNKEFNKIVTEENILMIGKPALKDIKPLDGGLEFTIEYEVIPEFEIADFKGLAIEEPIHPVGEDEIEEAIQNILLDNGTFEDAEVAVDNMHIVGVRMTETTNNEDGANAPREFQIFLSDKGVMQDLKDLLLNSKVGDKFVYKPSETANNEAREFDVEVLDIQIAIPAELNDELVTKVTNGRFNTIAEFREELGFSLQEQWDKRSRESMENQIVNKLVDLNSELPAPKSLVDQVLDMMISDTVKKYPHFDNAAEKKIMREEYTPMAERTVRWELIRNKIIEKEAIEVEDHDIDAIVEKEAANMKMEADKLKGLLKANPNFMQNILGKKVMDYILDFAHTIEVEFDHGDHHHGDGQDHSNDHHH